MKRIVLFLLISVLFTVVLLSVKNSYSAFTKNVQTSLEVTTPKLEAVFLPGNEFNTKIKQIAGDSGVTSQTENTSIISIVRSNVLNVTPTVNNVVSTSDSSFPIYAWFSSGVLYYYTEVEHPYMNEDATIMFYNLTNLVNIDLSTINTSRTTSMRSMFNSDINLESLDLSNFDTSKVETMEGMFFSMQKLKNIVGIETFNTSNVLKTIRMFKNCNALENLNLESFDLGKVNDTTGMLDNLNSLKELKTPSVYPNDTSVVITLPKTMYDENIVEYISLGKSINPTSPIETIIKEGYTVTFDANGGSVNPASKIVRYNDNYDLPTPTRVGYQFLGWNGKNLFNQDLLLNIDGATYTNNHYQFTFGNAHEKYGSGIDFSHLKQNTAYTLTIKGYVSNVPVGYSSIFFSFKYTDGTSDSRVIDETTETVFTLTSNSNKNIDKIIITYGSGTNNLCYISQIQLEEGTQSTTYEPYYVTNNTKVSVLENHTLKTNWIDNEEPSLSLSKITYKEGFEGWTFDNAYVDGSGTLILNANSKAYSNKYVVNKGIHYATFEGWTNTASTNYNPSGGVLFNMVYYDSSDNVTADTTSGYNYTSNGLARPLELNTWTETVIDHGTWIYGFDKTMYYISVSNEWSQPVTKLRNFKFWGETIPNNFYLINITSSDNEGVIETKYAKGSKNKSYFENNGIIVNNNQIRVTENGTYTVFVRDAVGNSKIETINITNIDTCSYSVGQTWNYSYTGDTQLFTTPCIGKYKIELWGAQGGTNAAGITGSNGSYVSGEINLYKNTSLLIDVGSSNGYNGGGSSSTNGYSANIGAPGGGATDIRVSNFPTANSSDITTSSYYETTSIYYDSVNKDYYGPYIKLKKGYYRINIYGTNLNNAHIAAVYEYTIKNYDILSSYRSNDLISLYIYLPDDLVTYGLEIIVTGDNYTITKEAFSRLDDRIMVAGGGGGAGGTTNNDGTYRLDPGTCGYGHGGNCIQNSSTNGGNGGGSYAGVGQGSTGDMYSLTTPSWGSIEESKLYGENGTNGLFGIGGTGGATGMYKNSLASFMDMYSGGTGGGGGAGYFGGGGGGGASGWWANPGGTGGGGSSYISGQTGSISLGLPGSNTEKSGCTAGTTNIECSIHYSGLKFTNTKIIDGAGYIWTGTIGNNVGICEPDGTNSTGHSGNGYARITLISVD